LTKQIIFVGRLTVIFRLQFSGCHFQRLPLVLTHCLFNKPLPNLQQFTQQLARQIPLRFKPQAPRSKGWMGAFFKLAIANTLSNLMVPLAGLIDTAFLGHLEDIRYLNGVALATIIFNVIYWSFNFFRMGTTGPTAQAVGRFAAEAERLQHSDDEDAEIWIIVIRNSLLALGVGLTVLLLKDPIAVAGFSLLQAGPDVRAAAMDFYNGRILDAPAVLVNFVLLGWLLGRRKGRQVVVLAMVGNVSNILLDYGFIKLLGWGSYGAGLATALSQYLMLVVAIAIIVAEGIPWHLWPEIKSQLWQPAALRSLWSLNFDIMLRTFALVISMSLFTNVSSGMGDTILGVNTLLIQVVLLAAHFMDGIALAVESYAGSFYGQKASGDLYWLLGLGMIGSLTLGFAIALTLILWPSFFSLLTSHRSLLTQVPHYVAWLLPVLGFGGIAFTLDGYFLGLSAGRTLRNATLIAALGGFLPLALVASRLQSPHLLWLALASLMATRVATLFLQVPPTLQGSKP
jgi:multidrug resistance protein, MATE family